MIRNIRSKESWGVEKKGEEKKEYISSFFSSFPDLPLTLSTLPKLLPYIFLFILSPPPPPQYTHKHILPRLVLWHLTRQSSSCKALSPSPGRRFFFFSSPCVCVEISNIFLWYFAFPLPPTPSLFPGLFKMPRAHHHHLLGTILHFPARLAPMGTKQQLRPIYQPIRHSLGGANCQTWARSRERALSWRWDSPQPKPHTARQFPKIQWKILRILAPIQDIPNRLTFPICMIQRRDKK